VSILQPRVFEASFKRVIDGDTFELWFDLGFDTWQAHEVRLKGVDTPEKGHSLYQEAKDLTGFVLQNRKLIVTTYKRESGTYDMSLTRYVADVLVVGEPQIGNLATYLVNMGMAKYWDGKGPHPWS